MLVRRGAAQCSVPAQAARGAAGAGEGARPACELLLCEGGLPAPGDAAVAEVSWAQGVLRGGGCAGPDSSGWTDAGAVATAGAAVRSEPADLAALAAMVAGGSAGEPVVAGGAGRLGRACKPHGASGVAAGVVLRHRAAGGSGAGVAEAAFVVADGPAGARKVRVGGGPQSLHLDLGVAAL